MSKEQVVAQDQGAWRAIQKIFGQNKGLGQAIGWGLFNIGKRHPPVRSIPQKPFELFHIFRRRDNRDLANIRQHQNAQRIIDHRLIIDWQQLFRYADCDREKTCARPARQNNAFTLLHPLPFSLCLIDFTE